MFSLLRFIFRCFILFDVMVNGIISSICPSNLWLLMHSNATDFSVLLVYPENLPDSMMSSSSFK